jgi:hypothetical protein
MLVPKWIYCYLSSLLWVLQPRTTQWHYQKKLNISIHWEPLIAYRFLFLSTTRASTLLEDIAVLEAADVSWNGGCVRCIEERHCGGPWNLMITARWVSTVTRIVMNKHLRIPKSSAARIGWSSVPLINVHRRIAQNNFQRRRLKVLSW